MCTPPPLIKIRILDLFITPKGSPGFSYDGLYIVVRIGAEAHRTAELSDSGDSSWGEVFTFRPDSYYGYSTPQAPVSDIAQISSSLPTVDFSDNRRSYVLPPPQEPLLQLHTIEFELWRSRGTVDGCLAVCQLCVPDESTTNMSKSSSQAQRNDLDETLLDRVLQLTSASPYSINFALRVRVATIGLLSTNAS